MSAPTGTVGVSYYDFRNNTPAPATLETDYFLVHCHPTTPTACANAANWGDEVRVTNTSFDMRQAPNAAGFFTGDYEGLDNIGTAFTSFFSQPHETDPSSTFFPESDRHRTDASDWGGCSRHPPQSAERSWLLRPERARAVPRRTQRSGHGQRMAYARRQ
jgi:hypothetical protein